MTPKEPEAGTAGGSNTESPGRLLAAAREAQSIGAADLALRLRLDAKIIKALERDDFENLPEPTFIKGYIRSIAKELGIDSAPIVDAYTSHGSAEPPNLADFSSRPPEQVGINSTAIKFVSYGVAAVLVILAAAWWRGNYQNDDTQTPLRSDASDELPTNPLPYSYEVVTHETNSWRLAPPSPSSDEVATGELESTTTSAPLGDGRTHELSIATTSEAWVEVYDAAGERLFFGMAKSGRTIELKDEVYYRLILGNSESIALKYDGAAIDLNAHSEQGVAQLELGEKPSDPN